MNKKGEPRHGGKPLGWRKPEGVRPQKQMRAYPEELSGGEQQRVAIARAVIHKPSLLLADEPTGNLDTKNGNEIMELLKASNRKYKQTIIMITHNLELAKQADRILVMEDGIVRENANVNA